MRRPDQDELSEDPVDAGTVGDGFGASGRGADVSRGYGTDDGFYGDNDESFDADSADRSHDDQDSVTVDQDGNGSLDTRMTEQEAEKALEDIFDDTYGSSADEVVEELEDSTGMSAVELLEDILGVDLDGSEDGPSNDRDGDIFNADADGTVSPLDVNPFDPAELPETEMPSEADFDLTGDGQVDHADLDEAADPFDFHVGE